MMRLIKLAVPVFLAVILCVLCTSKLSNQNESPRGENNLPSGEAFVNSEQSGEPDTAKEVSVPNSKTQKYILRYNLSNNKVEMITKKEDGTEIISVVEGINPYYLTQSDIDALTEGIELSSREDIFILIEDFSS